MTVGILGEHEGNILFVLSGRAAAAVAAAAFSSNCEYDPASGDILVRDQRVGNLPLVKIPGFRKIPGIPGESREVTILALPEERRVLLEGYRGTLRDKIARLELEARRLRLLLEGSLSTQRVREALNNTPPEYLDRCLSQRSDGPARAGSYYPGMDNAGVEAALLAASWVPYEHPAVQAPACAFKASLPGIVDLVALEELSPEHEVLLSDPKGTGSVEALVRLQTAGIPVEHTTVLLGPSEGKEVVWTFFPGDPIRPSWVPSAGNHGRRVTAREAMAMGLTIAKVH